MFLGHGFSHHGDAHDDGQKQSNGSRLGHLWSVSSQLYKSLNYLIRRP